MIFCGPLGSVCPFLSHFENSLVLLKPVVGGVIGVGHLTSIKTESAVFISLVYSLLPKNLNL